MRGLAVVLTAAGAVIWLLGVVAWSVGVWATLPPDAVRALVLALALLAGGVLLIAGAVVGRAARRGGAPPPLGWPARADASLPDRTLEVLAPAVVPASRVAAPPVDRPAEHVVPRRLT